MGGRLVHKERKGDGGKGRERLRREGKQWKKKKKNAKEDEDLKKKKKNKKHRSRRGGVERELLLLFAASPYSSGVRMGCWLHALVAPLMSGWVGAACTRYDEGVGVLQVGHMSGLREVE